MRTKTRKDDDIVIDFIGMNYLKEIQGIIDIIGDKSEEFLTLMVKKDVYALYNEMINNGFIEENYKKLDLEYNDIELLISNYNVNPNLLLLIKNNEQHDLDFYIETLDQSSESFISDDVIYMLLFAKENNISYLDLVKLFVHVGNSNIIESLINITIINEYKIDINEILEFKKLYPQKTSEYYFIFENKQKLPGINNILTPIYKYYNKETSLFEEFIYDVTYKYSDFKYNLDALTPTEFEVFTQQFFNLIEERYDKIIKNSNTIDKEYKSEMLQKSIKLLSNEIDNYLTKRVKEISNNISNCDNLEDLYYKMNKVPLFWYKNNDLVLEKMEYTHYKINKLLKEYNVISSN